MRNSIEISVAGLAMREFEKSVPMLLYRALDDVLPRFRALFARFGLTETQWRVLRVLWEREDIGLRELSRLTRIPAPSLVGVIDRLEERGWVERRRSRVDRRAIELALSSEGRHLERAVRGRVAAIYAEIDACLTPSQWNTLRSLLDDLHRGLEAEETNAMEAAS